MKLLYEPWGLGDACIASAIAASLSESNIAVGCRSKWHEAISCALAKRGLALKLVAVDLAYGHRHYRDKPLILDCNSQLHYTNVYSVRGDFRDFINMKQTYRGSSVMMRGWVDWIARRYYWIDVIWRLISPPTSRYGQWFKVLNEDSASLFSTPQFPKIIKKVGIHVGAQWKSKQYPFVAELAKEFNCMGISVNIFAGRTDEIPEHLSEVNVIRCEGRDMVEHISMLDLLVSNDSGPMHLAFLAGVPTFALVGTSNAQEWVPPGVRFKASTFMPKGYKSNNKYATDCILPGWPTANEVFCEIQKLSEGAQIT